LLALELGYPLPPHGGPRICLLEAIALPEADDPKGVLRRALYLEGFNLVELTDDPDLFLEVTTTEREPGWIIFHARKKISPSTGISIELPFPLPAPGHAVWKDFGGILKAQLDGKDTVFRHVKVDPAGPCGVPVTGKRIRSVSLARELGVSPMTVSLALRGEPGISDGVRDGVLRLARRRGMPGLAPKNPVALLLHELPPSRLGNWYQVAAGLRGAAQKMKWNLTVVELCSPAPGLGQVARNDRLRPDILLTIAHTRAWLDAARRAFGDLPMITLGCDSGKEDAVVEDQGGGISSLLDLAQTALAERVVRSGDRNRKSETTLPRVGYLSSWREGHWNEQAREAAVRFELARHGAAVAPGWNLLVPMVWDPSIPYAETDHGIYFDLDAFRKGVESSIARAPGPVPDLLICYNDRTAMAAHDALTRAGRKIPILTGWDLNPTIWTRRDSFIYSVMPDVNGACEALLEVARRRLDRPLMPRLVVRIAQARVGRVAAG
jgi:hypothetical protein